MGCVLDAMGHVLEAMLQATEQRASSEQRTGIHLVQKTQRSQRRLIELDDDGHASGAREEHAERALRQDAGVVLAADHDGTSGEGKAMEPDDVAGSAVAAGPSVGASATAVEARRACARLARMSAAVG